MAAMDWIAERIPDIAGKGVPLIVAGDSAGANLAAVISQLARDRGRSDIALQILIYPAIDGDIDARALDEISPPFLSKAELSWFFDQYVPNRALRTDPRFAPGRASNFSGLPAALVLTAENDLLRHEAEDYGRKLVEAGVPVLMKRYLGTIHGFFTLDAGLKHCAEAHADIAAFIRAFCRRAEEN
jgi:acetyl esterase